MNLRRPFRSLQGVLPAFPRAIPGAVAVAWACAASAPGRAAAQTCFPTWEPFAAVPGVASGQVESLVAFDDGGGSAVFAGGTFKYAGDRAARLLAKWDGAAWSNIGDVTGTHVYALIEYGGRLVIGGSFSKVGTTTAFDVAAWNGSAWAPLGAGITGGHVTDFAIYGDKLVAVGTFTGAGGQPAARVAVWDGASWAPFGAGIGDPGVQCATVFEGDLVVGGQFTTAGGLAAEDVARWDGTAWAPIGAGLPSGSCYALATIDPDGAGPQGDVLVAGGTYGLADMKHLLQWDGVEWTKFQGGASNTVWTLRRSGEDLIVGGRFQTVGPSSVEAPKIARWNATSGWTAMGAGLDPAVNAGEGVAALTEWNGALVVGGVFETEGVRPLRGIAAWDGIAWSPFGVGAGGDPGSVVNELLPDGDGFIAGGFFATLGGGVAAHNVARWSPGSGWAPLGDGLGSGFDNDTSIDDEVTALVFHAGELVAGHVDYNSAGLSGRLSRWDGNAWALEFSIPTNQTFNDLLVHEGELYAAGDFTSLGGVIVNRVALVNGAVVEALGDPTAGVNNVVEALASFGGDLIVGGTFSQAGGAPAARVARWDGATWSAMGAGVPSAVRAFVVHDGLLHAGCDNGVYKWDGAAWTRIVATNGPVRTFASAAPALYFAGAFTSAGGKVASRAAVWDGAAVQLIGGGFKESVPGGGAFAVEALLVEASGTLVAGGNHLLAGQKVSPLLTRFTPCAITGNSGLLPDDLAAHTGALDAIEWRGRTMRGETPVFTLDLPIPTHVDVALFDVRGRRLGGMRTVELPAGAHRFDAAALVSGRRLASGVYFARLEARAEGAVATRVVKVVTVN